MKDSIKIAYIGGGSRQWARNFMQDLALAEGLEGEVRLYDIDIPAAERNQIIGEKMQAKPQARSHFHYLVCRELSEALEGVDFVLISILPGTFREMRSDVHAPEAYGIWQSVGDTVGPGGVLRAMRTVPIYEDFARAIWEHCPDAWVLNLTNPMSICVKTLYRIFPQIKAFGCCHEVFHTQDFLCCVLKEMTGKEASRRDIYTDASGINHFTWITEARYQETDLLALMPEFMERYYESGYCERGPADLWKTDTFACGNRVKMDLLRRYGALAAAGDRHLAEFVNGDWYLKDPETVAKWHFALTTVDYREEKQDRLVRESIEMAEGRMEVPLAESGEELVRLLRGILGEKVVISNVNLPNRGQMPGIPSGAIVETNCIFTNGFVEPVVSKPLPSAALALVRANSDNIDILSDAIEERDMEKIFSAFLHQPSCAKLSIGQARELFRIMCENTRPYLEPYFRL
ncbi:MAG: alpha-glucosidase/alpha-galactosidase [Clostridiales bacterium]|nr:alpha-glucosidase/alpha-galactosidase [Clostridiales bacterium]